MLLSHCKCLLKRLCRRSLTRPTGRDFTSPPGASYGLLGGHPGGPLGGSKALAPQHPSRYGFTTLLAHFCSPMSFVQGYGCRGAAMKCLACGAEMRLINVRSEATTPFAIERRIFQCSSCRQSAQRLGFDRTRMPFDTSPAITPSNAPTIKLQPERDGPETTQQMQSRCRSAQRWLR